MKQVWYLMKNFTNDMNLSLRKTMFMNSYFRRKKEFGFIVRRGLFLIKIFFRLSTLKKRFLFLYIKKLSFLY